MKVKTNTLTGLALDYAVALAEGANPAMVAGLGRPCAAMDHGHGFEVRQYSTNGPDGDYIIDREKISAVWDDRHNIWRARLPSRVRMRVAGADRQVRCRVHTDGPTRRIAAMRAWVMFKLGDEVEIPDELLED